MYAPDKNFRMKSTFKAMVALTKVGKGTANGWKKMFIDAQLSEEAARRAALKSKDSGESKGRPRGAVAPE